MHGPGGLTSPCQHCDLVLLAGVRPTLTAINVTLSLRLITLFNVASQTVFTLLDSSLPRVRASAVSTGILILSLPPTRQWSPSPYSIPPPGLGYPISEVIISLGPSPLRLVLLRLLLQDTRRKEVTKRMSSCVPTPISTAFSTVTVDTITTTYSFSTSAVPPVVTTHVDPYCENEAVLLDSTVCLKTGTKTGTETLQRTSPSLMI